MADNDKPGMERSATFAALRSPTFRLFWSCNLVYFLGEWMQLFGLGYLVVELGLRDGDAHLVAFYAGLVGLSQAVPGLCLGLFGGVAADHVDRRRILFITQTTLGTLTGILGLLIVSGDITIAEVLAINCVASAVRVFDDPTRYSWIPGLVPSRYLVSAIGLNTASYTSMQIFGPMVGGLLYLSIGTGGLFLVTAACYVVVAAGQLFLPLDKTGTAVRERPRPLRSVAEGLAYVVRDPVTLWVLLLCAASQFLVRPYTQLLAAFAKDSLHVGATGLSWLLGASGVGAFAGALVIASLGSLERRGRFLLCAGTALGFSLLLLGTQHTMPAALGAVVVLALMVTLFQGTVNTILQLRTPDRLRGRVLSVLMTIPLGILPLGTGALGFVGSATSVATALSFAGLAFGLVSLAGLAFARGLRRARIRRHVEPEPHATSEVLLADAASSGEDLVTQP
ncbi:MAG TPA: MFS transporter [Jatrophihabitans sp.]|jgi:MFS family permease|nr:MFS transporter [Jatrophihabitans sp.]